MHFLVSFVCLFLLKKKNLTKNVHLFIITHSTTWKNCLLLLAMVADQFFFSQQSHHYRLCRSRSLLGTQDVPSFFPTVKITTSNFCCYHLIRVRRCLQTLIKVSRWAISPCFLPASVCARGESEGVKESLTIPLMISVGWETLVAHVDKQL